MRPARTIFLITLMLASALGAAVPPDLSQFDPVLVPLLGEFNGINGSRFVAALSVVGPGQFSYYAGGYSSRSYDGLARIIFEPASGAPGRIVSIERQASPKVWFHGFLASFDAANHESRTILPVVRLDDFVTGPSVLFPVQSDPGRRFRLRIYTLGESAVFRVSGCIMPLGGFSNDCAGGVQVITSSSDDPSVPGYAEIDLRDIIRCIVFLPHSGCQETSYRIFVTPESENTRYWPLLSATDNATQQIELFVPQ